MATEDDVRLFLDEFKTKMKIWDVLFLDNRSKNTQALLDLDIRPIERKAILEQLAVHDYIQGPIQDRTHQVPDLWVFGQLVKQQEIYIKISMGHPGTSTICISFHLAEYPLNYHFK